MRISRFVKWSVDGGAEGYQVDLDPSDIGQVPAGEINLALDQVRILMYLATYLIYSRELADGRMTKPEFDKAMDNFKYERKLVGALTKDLSSDDLKDKVQKINESTKS